MEKATRKNLAKVAEKAAQIPFHGYIEGEESNLEPIIRFFPQWTLKEADGLWCAAFVYYCCREAGFDIPIRPEACKSCHLAAGKRDLISPSGRKHAKPAIWQAVSPGKNWLRVIPGSRIIKAVKVLRRKRATSFCMTGFLKTGNMIISVLSLKTGEIRSSLRKGILPTDRGSSSARRMRISGGISEFRTDTNIGG